MSRIPSFTLVFFIITFTSYVASQLSFMPCTRLGKLYEEADQIVPNNANRYFSIVLTCFFRFINENNDEYSTALEKVRKTQYDYNLNRLRIPKVIHNIWVFGKGNLTEGTLPLEFCQALQQNAVNYPDFQLNLWTNDPQTLKSINKNCIPSRAQILDIFSIQTCLDNILLFKAIKHFISKKIYITASEIIKPLLLESFGGIVLNCGIKLLISPALFHKIFSFYAGAHFDLGIISGSLTAAKPHHPILQDTLHIIRDTLEYKYDSNLHFVTFDFIESIYQISLTAAFVRFSSERDYLFDASSLKHGRFSTHIYFKNRRELVLPPIGEALLYWVGRDNKEVIYSYFDANEMVDSIHNISINNSISYHCSFNYLKLKNNRINLEKDYFILFFVVACLVAVLVFNMYLALKRKRLKEFFVNNKNELELLKSKDKYQDGGKHFYYGEKIEIIQNNLIC